MKIRFFLFFIFLFLLVVAGAFAETQYGSQAKVAFGGKNVDLETFADQKIALLSSPADEAGKPTLTAVYFLFNGKGNEGAVGLTVKIDGIGDGYFSIVDAKRSGVGNIIELIFPLGDLREDENKKSFIKIANPSQYMDSDGNIEVHFTVVGGQCFTLNTISMEFEKKKTPFEFGTQDVRLVCGTGYPPPPSVPKLLLFFHHGEVWLWGERNSLGKIGWGAYRGKPKNPPVSMLPEIEKYIFHFNQEAH